MHIKLADYVVAFILLYTALCPDPFDIDFGTVILTGNSIGDSATYSCNPGFELIGVRFTTCTQIDANFAEFQLMPPTCRREYTE